MRHTTILFAILAAACGSGLPSGDSTGDGSGTLEIEASLDVENNFVNATDANDFNTELTVEVKRADVDVSGAIVFVETDNETHELVESTQEPGHYRLQVVGYAGHYQLTVESGDDFVSDVRLEGPSIHTFAAPLAGATVAGGDALTVEWNADDRAEIAAIETDEMDRTVIEDTGSFVLPVGSLARDEEEIEEDRIRLWRTNQLSPAGATGSSTLSVSVRNELEILVAP